MGTYEDERTVLYIRVTKTYRYDGTHHSTRSLRLSNTNLLCAPFVRTSFGSRSFIVAAPKIWNSLPRLFECVPAMIPFVINSRPTTSSWPSNPLSASSLAPQIRLWLTIVRVYKLYLLTYLLTNFITP